MISEEIVAALRTTIAADFAIAFWGADAAKKMGLGALSSARILCDAQSGACNPNEIEVLLKLGFSIKTIRGMHAKVYLLPNLAIVGSANASANGLGDEGAAAKNEEAAISTSDVLIISEIRNWFDDLWEKGTDIRLADLAWIRELWVQRQANRPRSDELDGNSGNIAEFLGAPLDERCDFLLRYFKDHSIHEMRRDQANDLLKIKFGVEGADLAWVTRELSRKQLIYISKENRDLVKLTDSGQRFLASL